MHVTAGIVFLLTAGLTKGQDISTEESVVCLHGEKTYRQNEVILTENVCLHCTCDSGWLKFAEDSCAIIDCPWDFYTTRTNCIWNRYLPHECCPLLDCGPWHPNEDHEWYDEKRPKPSMDGVNMTFTPDLEITLFCIDQSGSANPNTTVTWTKRNLNGETKAISGSYINKRTFVNTSESWGFYLEKATADDAGQYTCTIHTSPPQTETSFLHFRKPSSIPRNSECYEEAENTTSCLYPVASNYYFNASANRCEQERVTTCRKAGNHFVSFGECRDHCADKYPCDRQVDLGPCTNQLLRFYYDKASDSCKIFLFGGCEGNANNFKTKEDCERVCQKVVFEARNAVQWEENLPGCQDCPWHLWGHYLKHGCIAMKEKGACCPNRFDCSSEARAQQNRTNLEIPVWSRQRICVWKGVSYQDGEKISLSEFCQVCYCRSDFDGPGSPGCQPKICSRSEDAFLNISNCVPVFTTGNCCPQERICPPSSIYAQRPPLKINVEPEELHCHFGKMFYPRGYKMLLDDPCLDCTCITPPFFTCERILCPFDGPTRCSSDRKTCCGKHCWDVRDLTDIIGEPQSQLEKNTCLQRGCPPDHRCLVNYNECFTGHCQATCEPCNPSVNCSARSYQSVSFPFRCPSCLGPSSPEQACEWIRCPPGFVCEVMRERMGLAYINPTCRKGFSPHSVAFVGGRPDVTIVCNVSCPSPCRLLRPIDNGCPICHCDTQATLVSPCSDIECNSSCFPGSPDSSGCSNTCICPQDGETACELALCPSQTECLAKDFRLMSKELPTCIRCLTACEEPCFWLPLRGTYLSSCPLCRCTEGDDPF